MKKIILITLVAILLPLVFFSVFGCMKKPEHKPDYGPEVPFDNVKSALQSLGRPNPYNIKVGQFAYFSIERSIDITSPQVIMQMANTVTARTEDASSIHYTVITKGTAFEDGIYKPIDPQSSTIIVDKPAAVSSSIAASIGASSRLRSGKTPLAISPMSRATIMSTLERANATTPVKISFHNLASKQIQVPTPDLVKASPTCGGFTPTGCSNCSCPNYLDAMQVSFDRVVWKDEEKGQKRHYQITTSPQIPTVLDMTPDGPTASIDFQYCQQDWLEIQGRTVPVTTCQELKDFKFSAE